MDWIIQNKEWIFSGIGVFIISLIITLIIKKKSINKKLKQEQKSGDNSINFQVAGDINIGKKNDK
jgi:hypothetical protein